MPNTKLDFGDPIILAEGDKKRIIAELTLFKKSVFIKIVEQYMTAADDADGKDNWKYTKSQINMTYPLAAQFFEAFAHVMADQKRILALLAGNDDEPKIEEKVSDLEEK
mgnify:CR=1 FL=1